MSEELNQYRQTIKNLSPGDIFLMHSQENANPKNETLTLSMYDHTAKSASFAEMVGDEALKKFGKIEVLVNTAIIQFKKSFSLGSEKIWLPENTQRDIFYGARHATTYMTSRNKDLKFKAEIYVGETDIRKAMTAHGNEYNMPLILKILDSSWRKKK